MKGATASLRNCGRSISQVLYFENSFFRIEQFTMLFSAQKVLC